MPTATATKPKAPDYGEVLETLKSISSESDMWHLADAVLKVVPDGTAGLREIVDKASSAGLTGGRVRLSVNTLRAYRTTAKTFPPDKRMPNVSFSAHREVEKLGGGYTAQRALLNTIAKANKGKVTVDQVRAAVRAKQGKPAKSRPARAGNAGGVQGPQNPNAALNDLEAGGKQLIAAIDNVEPAKLDKLHAGAKKVLAHIENLQMQRARKAKNAKAPAATSTQTPKKQVAPSNGAAKTPVKAGRLKGL